MRWLTALSHRLVFTFVSATPRASHLTNLALHLVNGVLVYGVALAWVSPAGALVTTAAFLLHPIQTEAVAYVASRSELLATTCALLALWLTQRRVRSRWTWALVWLCVAAAVCAKESAAVVVPLIALSAWARGVRVARGWWIAGLVPVVAMAISVFWFDYHRQARGELSPVGYAATQATAVWRYLALVVWPMGLTIDHDVARVPWILRGLALATLLAGVAGAILLLASISDETGQRRRLCDVLGVPLAVAVGGVWVAVALTPRFLVPTSEVLNEHQTLLPFVGVWLAVGALVAPREAGPC